MARPKKDPSLLMDVDLRIPVTREQKALIFQAAIISQEDIAGWVRPLLIQAARNTIAKNLRQKRKAG
jgi:uncharacterized protein (DUF1778 family)